MNKLQSLLLLTLATKGDFNSHNSDWGYDQNDDNEELLLEWIALHNFELIYNVKEMGTFRLARWRRLHPFPQILALHQGMLLMDLQW